MRIPIIVHRLSPQQPPSLRALARQSVDAWSVSRLAQHILNLRSRRDDAKLGHLDMRTRHELEQDAALALLSRDESRHRPAIYVAADSAMADLGAMRREDRVELIAVLERVFATYRLALAGEYADEARRLGLLALADLQADPEAPTEAEWQDLGRPSEPGEPRVIAWPATNGGGRS